MHYVFFCGRHNQEALLNEAGSIVEFLYGKALSNACQTEQRRANRENVTAVGRLAYGGLKPGLIGCQVIDLSDTGVRVETYVHLDPVPEVFSFEFGEIYCRARRRWARDNQIGLEFIFDEPHP